jgi:hypothetical protein
LSESVNLSAKIYIISFHVLLGEYTMEYCRYSPAKQETQEKIHKEHQAKLEEGNPQKAAGKKKKN